MTDVSTVPGYAVQRRRRWMVRVLSAGMVLMAAAYAALPVWLPTDWLARRLVDRLASDLGRPVRIGAVRLGWVNGLVFEDLAIAEGPGMPNPLLARARRVRCRLTPIMTLLTGRVDQLEIDGPELWLVFDDEGRLANLTDLGQKPGRRLPSLSYVIRQAACHVLSPRATQTFRIDKLQCDLEPRTGLLRLFGEAVVSRADLDVTSPAGGRLTLDAKITVPRLKHDETLRGDVRVEWVDLALTDLPLPFVTPLPIEQVDGVTTGQLMFAVRPDLGIDYDLFIVFDGVRILRRGLDRPAQVPDAELHCGGHWDPNNDTVLMRALSYETRAIYVTRLEDPAEPDKPAMLIDPNGETRFALRLAGRVKDWPALRREFPEVDTFARAVGATFAGSAGWTVVFTQSRDKDDFALTVDGGQSRWVVAGEPADYLVADVGIPKTLRVKVVRDRKAHVLSQPDVSLAVGDLSLTTRSRVAMPITEVASGGELRWWLADVLPTLQLGLALETARVEQAVVLLPFLGHLTDVTHWRGPLAFRAFVVPGDDVSQLRVTARMGPETALAFGDWFDKPPGEELTLAAGVGLPHRATGRIDDLSLEVTHGTSRAGVGPGRARLEYRSAFLDPPEPMSGDEGNPADRPIGIDATWEIPLEIEHIEGLLSLCPRWQRQRENGSENELSGSVDLVARSSVSYRPDDWLVRNELEMAADDLTVRWGEAVDKGPGTPLAVTASHQSHLLGARREHALGATLRRPAGELTGSITFAGMDSGDVSDDFEHATIRADMSDVEDFLTLFPGLRKRLAASFQARGAVAFDIDSLLIDGEQSVSVSADATDAEVTIHSDPPVRKPAGMAAAFGFQWHTDLVGSPPDRQRWTLTEGFGQLAGARVTGLSGDVVTGWEAARMGTGIFTRKAVDGKARTPILESATVHARGTVTFDESLAGLHPQLADWQHTLGLSGNASWDLDAHLEPKTLELTGRIDASEANVSFALHNDLVPAVHKPPASPGVLTFDLAAHRLHDAGAYRVDCEDVSLDLEGNHLAARGTLFLSRQARRPLQFGDLALTTDMHLQRPHRALALLEGSRIARLEGGGRARVEVIRSGDRTFVGSAELDFDKLAIDFGSGPVHLDGRVAFDETGAEIGQLRWAWGPSGGVVSGSLQRRPDGRIGAGRIGLALDHLDLEDLRWRLDSLPRLRGGAGKDDGPTRPAGRLVMARLFDELREADLAADVHVGSLEASLPLDVNVLADAAAQQATMQGGQMDLAFRALVDGGSVTGRFTSNLAVEEPTFHLAYTARRIQPGAVVDKYLARTFPGMKATGPLTLIDESYQKLLPGRGDPNVDVGAGELIIEGGTIEGRAAPLWMTAVFPGLNLARFHFSYMHSWFDKLPNGRVYHQMIFQGRWYHMYMDGYSDPAGHMEYEVGIDFLADFDSRYWADLRHGRIPLFNKTGRILPDGTLADERVDYVPQRFVVSLLFGNNPVLTAYHAIRKRVRDQ